MKHRLFSGLGPCSVIRYDRSFHVSAEAAGNWDERGKNPLKIFFGFTTRGFGRLLHGCHKTMAFNSIASASFAIANDLQ